MGKNLREHLESVRYVVIDEIHELAGSKRGAQLSVALERIVEQAGEFQRIALSATVGNPEDVARFLCGDRPYHLVNIPSAPRLSIDVKYAGGEFSSQAKFVSKLIDKNESVLIFVNTRTTAEALGQQLFDRGDVEVHHGSLSREVRIEAGLNPPHILPVYRGRGEVQEPEGQGVDLHVIDGTRTRHRPYRACPPVRISP